MPQKPRRVNGTMPTECEVIIGEYTEEPNPLPDDYYEGYSYEDEEYEKEECPANNESGTEFSYPGTIFPYSPHADQSQRTAYTVPTRDNIESVLSAAPVSCGLPSDPANW